MLLRTLCARTFLVSSRVGRLWDFGRYSWVAETTIWSRLLEHSSFVVNGRPMSREFVSCRHVFTSLYLQFCSTTWYGSLTGTLSLYQI